MDEISRQLTKIRSRLQASQFIKRIFALHRITTKLEMSLVWAFPAIISCIFVSVKGQDINWDQQNYHLYSIYAILHGKMSENIIPSQLQTWTNPFGNVIQYFIVMTFHPLIASIILAAISSISVSLIYFITKTMIDNCNNNSTKNSVFISILSAICAFFSPLFISEIGTTFSDYLGNIFILLSILLVWKKGFSIASYFFAGALLGVAMDIKLTNAIFVFGWVAAIIAVETKNAIRPLVASGAGAVATYLPIGGAWNIYVYHLFKNPLFPLYNHVFKSDSYPALSMLDQRFKPKSFAEALEYFPKWALGEHPTNELYFRDSRFLIALIVVVLSAPCMAAFYCNRKEHTSGFVFEKKRSLFILAFSILSFIAWLNLFGIERYAILLEQLAPIVILISLSLLCASQRTFVSAAVMSVALIVGTTSPPSWGRAKFAGDWGAVATPTALLRPNTMFVMLTGEPMSYVIPYLPTTDIFIRIEGNMPLDPDGGLGRTAQQKIRDHNGAIRTLAPAGYQFEPSKMRLASFGLVVDRDDCVLLPTKAGNLQSCSVTRVAQ